MAQNKPPPDRTHEKYQRLLDSCGLLPPTRTAVVHPCDRSSLEGAVDAARMGLIAPLLAGPRSRIEAVATESTLGACDASASSGPSRALAAASAGRVPFAIGA